MRHTSSRGRSTSVFRTRTSASSRGRRAARLARLALLCLLTASGCGKADGKEEAPHRLLGELARELDAAPAITPALSTWTAGPPCVAAGNPPPGGRTPCAGGSRTRPSARISAIAARARQAIHDRADPDAMHVLALIDLLYDPGAGKALQRAISSLQTAARLTDRPAPMLADLSAAFIVRSERAHTLRDLVAAVEAADEALEHEPGNRTARYNRALAMERLELLGEATQGWRDYLSVDSASGWASEARRHLEAVLAAPVEPPPPASDAPPAAYERYATAEPQRARELGWCRVLGAWAGAAAQGDSVGAEGHLRRAEVLGAALEKRVGGDATLADGVRSIRALTGGPARRRLAEAQREFSAGCELERQVAFGAAKQAFARAAALADGSPMLWAWARLHYGGAVFHSGGLPAGQKIFRALAEAVDTLRYPALAGCARQLLAATLLRDDGYSDGLEQGSRARRLFVRAGERENEGASLEALGVARFHLRDMDQGYALAWLALERLRPYRGSHRLHNMLGSVARVADEDGFPRAALRIQAEDVAVARRTGLDAYVVEAQLERALLFARAGNHARARRDIAATETALARIKDPRVRKWMAARRQMAEASALLHTAPARAAEALDSAAKFLQDTMGAKLVSLAAIVGGAQAHLAAGDRERGLALLDSGLSALERRRDRIRMEPRRAAVFEEARALVDRATMLMLASDSLKEALRYLDRGRASLSTVGARARRDAGGTVAGPPGEVALEYALVGDTLLVWTIAGERVGLYRTAIDTARLVRTIEHLRRQMEDGAGEAELRGELSQLYEWLVRPVETRLGMTTPLVVIADGDVGSIPFAALYDARRKRYLVEDHTLRFAASLREARRPARGAAAGAASLFIADPAFDSRRYPEFPRLNDAAAEAREIAGGYPRARVLQDTEANGTALREALGHATLVHYAGHAVFDDERPERSYLLLAPAPGNDTAATLEAGEIATMDLHRVSLVVLAACQTVRTGRGRADGFSGLAGAFLAAGAGGAVGSLWEVDDRLTRPLMIEFHRAYRADPDGPGALRAAQLRLLGHRDPALRSPAAWAGFRYAGS